jgi:hypothetical protein
MSEQPRIEREAQTLQAMFRLYCRGQHNMKSGLCKECQKLQDYALTRLKRCPFQEGKTTCVQCPIHCYKAEMRLRIREVMRFAGPRMLLSHPVLAIRHTWDGRRKEPLKELA